MLNPKLTLFFFAFLPQFVPVHSDPLPVELELSGAFMAMTLVVFTLYAAVAATARATSSLAVVPDVGPRLFLDGP